MWLMNLNSVASHLSVSSAIVAPPISVVGADAVVYSGWHEQVFFRFATEAVYEQQSLPKEELKDAFSVLSCPKQRSQRVHEIPHPSPTHLILCHTNWEGWVSGISCQSNLLTSICSFYWKYGGSNEHIFSKQRRCCVRTKLPLDRWRCSNIKSWRLYLWVAAVTMLLGGSWDN